MTDADRHEWQRQWIAAMHRVFDEQDKLRDDTHAWARAQSARHHRHPTAANKRAADDAWDLYRLRCGPLDALGRPLDPSYAGRAKFRNAWKLRTGLTWAHPDDEHTDTSPDHAAGLHDTLRHSFGGDLPACDACMEDELWHIEHSAHAAVRARKAGR